MMFHAPFITAAMYKASLRRSVLAWPAWLRLLAVAPSLALLWLAVAWALVEVAPL